MTRIALLWTLLGAVVLNASIQALLVGIAPVLVLDATGILLAIVSGLAMLGLVVVLWWLTGRSPRPSLILRCVAAGVLTVIAAVVVPPVVPLLLATVSPWIATGSIRLTLDLWRIHPWRTAELTLRTVIAVVLGWVVALPAGLFLGGSTGAFVTWAVIGLGAWGLIADWNRLARRPAREHNSGEITSPPHAQEQPAEIV